MKFYRLVLEGFAKPNWLYSLAIASIIWFTYAPVLWSNYAFEDDYFFLSYSLLRDWDGVYAVFMAGRPAAAVLLYWGFLAANSIDGLWMLRAFTLGGLSLAAICTFRAFRTAGHPHSRYADGTGSCGRTISASAAQREWCADGCCASRRQQDHLIHRSIHGRSNRSSKAAASSR